MGTVTNSSFGMAREITGSRGPLAGDRPPCPPNDARRTVTSLATVATKRDPRCRLLAPAGPVCNPPCSHTARRCDPRGAQMSVSAADIPDKTFLQTVGDRRSIRYYDPDKKVEDWKIQTILQSARLASCQGNINATEAIVVERGNSDLWDEIEECVSGFNVQIINQSSHLIFWLTNLNAWYGRANDGLSTLSLSGALTKYHGWNYEFTMTQTVPRLMSFPTERTENLLRFETRPGGRCRDARRVGARHRQHPHRLRPQAGRRREGLRPHAEPEVHLGARLRLPARGRQGRRPAPPPQVQQALPQGRLRHPARGRPGRGRGPEGQGHDPGAGPGRRPHRGDRRPRRQVQP